jgi:hypothetical protein
MTKQKRFNDWCRNYERTKDLKKIRWQDGLSKISNYCLQRRGCYRTNLGSWKPLLYAVRFKQN